MTRHPFDPTLDELPNSLPIFPLPGALLLPHGHLPLNIFEPRYLCMVDDALAGNRLIGMVQPRIAGQDPGISKVFGIGCAGKIASFSETDDGRYLITLRGLLRFAVERELEPKDGYRRITPEFTRFTGDLTPTPAESIGLDRERLMDALRGFFEMHQLSVDWEAVERLDPESLINTMAMLCPFDPAEKQALLEAENLDSRAEALLAVLEMSSADQSEDLFRH